MTIFRPSSLLAVALIVVHGCGSGDVPQKQSTGAQQPSMGDWSSPQEGDASPSPEAEAAAAPGAPATTGAMSANELTLLGVTRPDEVTERYHGNPITVTGVVQDIQPNRVLYYASTPRIEFHHQWTLQSDNFGPAGEVPMSVVCDCADYPSEPKSRETLAGIHIGQTVTVKGELWFAGADSRSVQVRGASIIASEQPPTGALPAEELMPIAELQRFLADYPEGEATLKKCNEFGSDAMTPDGTLKPEIVEGLRKLPSIDELSLPDAVSAAGLQQLATLPPIRKLRLNRLKDDVTAEELAQLARLPLLRSIEFYLISSDLLAGVAQIPGLQSLNFKKSDEEPLPELAHLTNLQSLSVTYVTDDDVSALGSLPQLRSLKIGAGDVNGQGFARLGGLKQLVSLQIESAPLTPEGSAMLGMLTSLRRLVVFSSLSGREPSDVGDLAFVSKLPDLQVLIVRGEVAAGCGSHLAGLGNLQALEITSPTFGDEELVACFAKPKAELKKLALSESPVGDTGLSALAKQPLPQLAELNLEGTQVGDAGLTALGAAAPPKLKSLMLNKTKVTDAGIARLKSVPGLQFVYASGTEVTNDALQKLLLKQ